MSINFFLKKGLRRARAPKALFDAKHPNIRLGCYNGVNRVHPHPHVVLTPRTEDALTALKLGPLSVRERKHTDRSGGRTNESQPQTQTLFHPVPTL